MGRLIKTAEDLAPKVEEKKEKKVVNNGEIREFKSFFKTVEGNEGNKCHYPTRLDTYGCGCQHDCSYCTSPDTQVLMYDGSLKPIKYVNVGDEIYGVVDGGTYKQFTKATVTNKMSVVKKAYKITLANGNELICSDNHQWLTTRGWKYTIGEMSGDNRRPYLTTNNKLMGFYSLFNIDTYEYTKDYQLGYLRGVILGDATLREYHYNSERREVENQYRFRLALKDERITDRAYDYLLHNGVPTNWFDFPMIDRQTKEHYTVRAIETYKKENYDKIHELIKKRDTDEFKRGFLAGIYDAEGTCDVLIRRVCNSDLDIISDIENALKTFGFDYVFDKDSKTVNKIVKTIRIVGGLSESLRFNNVTQCLVANNEGNISNIRLKSFNADELRVVSIEEYADETELIDITTTTRNFIANGVVAHNCYAKSLLDFRNLWDFQNPAVADINKIRKKVAKLPKDIKAIRLGGMTDCFQPCELTHKVTYETIKALNEVRQPYLIVTKSDIVAYDEYIDVMDKDLAHIQVTITCFNDDLYHKLDYEKAVPPSKRIEAVEKLYENGFDVQVRLSPLVPEFVDFDVLSNIKCDKLLVEFLRVNTWIHKWFKIDYTPYTVKQSGYYHMPLAKKKEIISQIKGFKEITVCEDESNAYDYWQNNFNPNKDDCCNLRF